jgi:hypothetical protein
MYHQSIKAKKNCRVETENLVKLIVVRFWNLFSRKQIEVNTNNFIRVQENVYLNFKRASSIIEKYMMKFNRVRNCLLIYKNGKVSDTLEKDLKKIYFHILDHKKKWPGHTVVICRRVRAGYTRGGRRAWVDRFFFSKLYPTCLIPVSVAGTRVNRYGNFFLAVFILQIYFLFWNIVKSE